MTDERDAESDDGRGVVAERVSPAAAFELVAHETRVGVLEALRAADGGPLSFGEIRAAVGVDDPGQCHYHVDRLVDRFVRKTEDGYVLSPAGWQLAGAVLSGALTASMERDSVPAEGACAECGGSLEAAVREHGVTIRCRACEFVQSDPDMPAAVLADWPREAIPSVVGRYVRRWEVSGAHGFCPNCDGRVDRRLCLPDDEAAPSWFAGEDADAVVVTDCRRCGESWHAAVPIAALAEPAVVAFHHQHDVDLRERPWWTLASLEFGVATVEETDPLRVAVPMSLADDRRTFVFDAEVELVEERRD